MWHPSLAPNGHTHSQREVIIYSIPTSLNKPIDSFVSNLLHFVLFIYFYLFIFFNLFWILVTLKLVQFKIRISLDCCFFLFQNFYRGTILYLIYFVNFFFTSFEIIFQKMNEIMWCVRFMRAHTRVSVCTCACVSETDCWCAIWNKKTYSIKDRIIKH